MAQEDPLLDVVLGYDCNLACDYCTITPVMRQRALGAKQVAAELRRGRSDGYSAVSFTGGEPTIRSDLLPLIREARRLGFDDVKLQTNGLMLNESNLARLLEAGVTRIHISIHTHRRDAYEAKVRRNDVYDAMESAVRRIAKADVAAHVDFIVDTSTVAHLANAVHWARERGIRNGFLWYVSLTDQNRDRIESLPPIREAMPHMHAAFVAAGEVGMDLRSLHVPRCLLGSYADRAHDPGARRVRVVTPEATFELRDAPLTPGAHVPACVGCEHESHCPGIRRDYLEVFGDAEIAEARGQTSRVPATRLPVVST